MKNDDVVSLLDQQMLLEDYWKTIAGTYNIQNNRQRRNVMFRHAFFTATRHFSNLSLNSIGRIIGRDHATVLHACKMHESNYTYDKLYRSTFDSMAEAIVGRIEKYTENLEDLMAKRLSNINVDVYENSMVLMYKRKLEKAEEMYEERLSALQHDLSVVTKQMKHHKRRAEKLNSECLRLKNLL